MKTITVASGIKLGVTVEIDTGPDGGAIVKSIGRNCVFKHQIRVGDKIATVDGKRVINGGEFHKRPGKEQVLGVVPACEYSRAPAAGKKRKTMSGGGSAEENPSAWQQKFYELILFQAANNGSSIIPDDDDEHRDLGDWVMKERIKYKMYLKGEILEQEQADHVVALKQIGFVFEARIPTRSSNRRDATWLKMYNELVEYANENDGANPKISSKLGKWVGWQRMCYKEYQYHVKLFVNKYPDRPPLLPEEMPHRKKRSDPKEEGMFCTITQARIDMLNSIEGFKWDLSPKWTSFEQRIEEYKEFQMEEGHGFIPQHYAANRPLGKWVSKMRYEYVLYQRGEHSQMTPERIQRLEAVGFEFTNDSSKRAAALES